MNAITSFPGGVRLKNFTKVSIALTTLGGILMMATPMAFASSNVGSLQVQGGIGTFNQSASGSIGSVSASTYDSTTTAQSSKDHPVTTQVTNGLNPSSTTTWGGSSTTDATGYNNAGGSITTSQTASTTLGGQGEYVHGATGSTNTSGLQYQLGSGTLNQGANGSVDSLTADTYSNKTIGPDWNQSTEGTNGLTGSSTLSGGGSTTTSGNGYISTDASISLNQSASGSLGIFGFGGQGQYINGNTSNNSQGPVNVSGLQSQKGSGTFNENLGGSVDSLWVDNNYTLKVQNPSTKTDNYTLDGNKKVTDTSTETYGGSNYIKNGDNYLSEGGGLSANQSALLTGSGDSQTESVGANYGGAVDLSRHGVSGTGVGAGVAQTQHFAGGSTLEQDASANTGVTTAASMNYGNYTGYSQQTVTNSNGSVTYTDPVGTKLDTGVTGYSNPSSGFTANQNASGVGANLQAQDEALGSFWSTGIPHVE
jgi:hypothetical protein